MLKKHASGARDNNNSTRICLQTSHRCTYQYQVAVLIASYLIIECYCHVYQRHASLSMQG